ncbi:50S ribosomal protein L32 [Orientia tsutsugamushi]|uniref:Large ribosomal subunit protein bL32 n=1 Tax=Orientia tsutsugamushi str. TA716 TaxID=1359175 RepID=A0A0F3P8X0_ORITS|nr:50S ribosomal protein L32 [Orientia tsutsugamushi]KJV76356.1 ribosomal protein L32 [Orientia tsutsugamushi str. TA716]
MAVPKKRTSASKTRMRRSHHALAKANVITDAKTGEYRLSHHVCMTHGTYNGRKVITDNVNTNDNNNNS